MDLAGVQWAQIPGRGPRVVLIPPSSKATYYLLLEGIALMTEFRERKKRMSVQLAMPKRILWRLGRLIARTCLALILSMSAGIAAQAADAPNFIIVLADDMGWGDVENHGNPWIETPRIAAFANAGVQLGRFYVDPVCSPSRAALLTGKYAQSQGVTSIAVGREVLPASATTIAEILRARGYRTALFGKWHNGMHFPNDARGQGFDHFFGFRGGYTREYFDADLERDGQQVSTEGYLPDVLTDAAIEFTARATDQPFFAVLSFNTPHAPFQAPNEPFQSLAGKGLPPQLAASYAMSENIDYNFGRMLDALAKSHRLETTYILFLSDNGPDFERYNGVLKGIKTDVSEGGTRVPAFFAGPGIKGGRRIDAPTAHIDVMPTILELAGISHSQTDGISLVDTLRGIRKISRRYLFSQYSGKTDFTAFPGAVRLGKWLAINEGRGWQLFDIASDPGQGRDLAGSRPALVTHLAGKYLKWFASLPAEGRLATAIELGHPEERVVTLWAHEARLSGPGIRYAGEELHSLTYITGWSDPGSFAEWPIDVSRGGTYRISLVLAADKDRVPSKLGVAVGSKEVIGRMIETQPLKGARLPSQFPASPTFAERWTEIELGSLTLEQGLAQLRLFGAEKGAETFPDVRGVRLTMSHQD